MNRRPIQRGNCTASWIPISLVVCTIIAVAIPSAHSATDDRPNFIFFITDDVSHNDLGCYGNTAIKTPHLDRIAKEGLVFDNAYLTISSCSPSRCSIITGRYPHNTGAPELHTRLPDDQFSFPIALKEAGYYTALSGKHHMGKAVNRGFDKVSNGKGPSKAGDWVDMLQERPKDKPFFFWFASSDAHRGWAINDKAPTYKPKDVIVPPFLVDGEQTRKDLVGYYHEVSRTDHYAGELIKELKRQGVADNTYLIYCTDNGRPFPRCKTRLYDSGIKTPLIVWCPGKVKPGRTSSLVSAIDFSATILDLAGLKRQPTIQGVSFAKILTHHEAVTRDFCFAEHNWHVYQAHQRMVRTGKWLYIKNNYPDRQVLCKESDPTFPAGKELWEAHKAGKLKPAQNDIFLKPRPKEELYDVTKDPYQLHNLALSDGHDDALKKMRTVLQQWTDQTGDSVPDNPTPDRDTIDGKRIKGWKHREFPGKSKSATTINHTGPVREDPS